MSLQVFFIFLKILILHIVSGVKEQKMTQNDKTLCSPHSMSQEPCIIWLSFMVHICKIIIFLCVLFLFSGSPGWWKGRKWSKMTKHSVCHTLYFRNYTSYDLHLWFTNVIFIFLKILILHIVSGVKEQKMTQNDKTLCSPHSMSQEPCIIWLSFMVHICKIIIFLCVLFLFSGSPGWWKGRKWSKMTKHSVCHTLYFRNYTSYDLHLWFTNVIYGTQV